MLDLILKRKTQEVDARRAAVSLEELRARLSNAPAPREFIGAIQSKLKAGKTAVIAEIKKASPSKGILRADFQTDEVARSYERGGAACLSILTDRDFFQGADEYLMEARAACTLPVLRKDFIIDPYQVIESRVIGADCILLIVAALDGELLNDLVKLTREIGMDVLVEIHNAQEADRVLSLDAPLIGINNRDLQTFEVRLETTIELFARIPSERIVVSESGITTSADISRLRAIGVNVFLIGETFMKAENPGKALADIVSDE